MRINKYIASCGICSRREAEKLVQDGRISVNGQMQMDLSTQITDTDTVCLDGQPISQEVEKHVYAFHKPKGITVSLSDPKQNQLLSKYTEHLPVRVVPVGRLDKESTGLLLLTNDGALVHRLTHPSFEKEKIYHVRLNKSVTDEALKQFQQGVVIDGKRTKRCFAKRIDARFVEVVLEEGRNRQIRKMWDALGYSVESLHRVAMDGIVLGNLPSGEIRLLTDKELRMLYES